MRTWYEISCCCLQFVYRQLATPLDLLTPLTQALSQALDDCFVFVQHVINLLPNLRLLLPQKSFQTGALAAERSTPAVSASRFGLLLRSQRLLFSALFPYTVDEVFLLGLQLRCHLVRRLR